MNAYDDLLQNIKDLPRKETKLSSGYSGSGKKDLSIPIPHIDTMVRTWCKKWKNILTQNDFENILIQLTRSDIHDFYIVAGKLLQFCREYRQNFDLRLLPTILENSQGWEEVDVVCAGKFTGRDFRQKRDSWIKILRELNSANRLELKRASLVLPIKFIRDLKDDDQLLNLVFEYILNLVDINDKLITKAISWVLREAIKSSETYKKQIIKFLKINKDQFAKTILSDIKRRGKIEIEYV